MVFNVMEDIVLDNINEQKKKYPNLCFCDNCIDDIMAIALNNLTPMYVTSVKGEAISRSSKILEQQNKMDTHIAVIRAIDFVSTKPRHTEDFN